jgi:biotin operon repressor
MRKKRKYLELTLEEGLVDAVDYIAERLSTTRTNIVRESLIDRLRKEGVDLLRPRRYRPRKPLRQAQPVPAPAVQP